MDRAILARVQKQAWFHRYPRGWPFLLFLLTMAGTILSVVAIERADRERGAIELDRDLTEVVSALERRTSENVTLLRAAAALAGTQEDLQERDFVTLAADMYNGENSYFGSLGLGWARRVPALEVGAFEVAQREAGHEDFLVHPRPGTGTPVATPIVFLQPATEANRRAIGYNMYSEAVRRAAIDAATRTRDAVASGPVRLVQDKGRGDVVGFVIYLPVYARDSTADAPSGYIYSPFRAGEFLESVVSLSRERPIEIAIYDGPPTPENLLAVHAKPGQVGRSLTRKVAVAGRGWTLKVSTKRATALSVISRATLLFGVILSLLMMYIGRMISKRAAEDRHVLEWLSRQSAIRDSLTRELNHRVKNTLANVLSIVALTRRRALDLDDFSQSLTARIRALGATHDLLSQSNWSSAELGEVVRSELAPYIQDDEGHVTFAGPEIRLAPNDALSLGLAIHELATNAAKYGALSTPEGRVAVTWERIQPDRASIHWAESGGPPVVEPTRRGFGRDLIERVVAHELQSQVELEFRPEGVSCRLLVPIRQITEFALRRGSVEALPIQG